MITCYFGVPGVGKSTLLSKIAIENQINNKNNYKDFYCMNIDITGCKTIEFKDLAKYKIYNSLILIDEITKDADNREFKSFPKEIRDFIIYHRHLGCDIIYATQNYEKVDKIIRDLTAELWYMQKSVLPIINKVTTAKRIYRNIAINEYTSDLIMGYRFCTFLEGIFASNRKIVYRKRYYPFFDTYEEGPLKEREEIPKNIKINKEMKKTGVLIYLNSIERKIKKWKKIKKLKT